MVQSSLVVKKKIQRKCKSSHHKAIMTQRLLTSFKYFFLCYDCDVKALFEVWCKVISLVSKQ